MRIIETGSDSRLKVKRGIDLAAKLVGGTIGPRGRNVNLDTNPYSSEVRIINDGVKILRELKDSDPFISNGIKIVRSAAEKTNDLAGDGTTTTAVLTAAIVEYGMQQLASGKDAVAVREEIDTDLDSVLLALQAQKQQADSIEALTNVATISCGNPKLGAVIADAIHQVGVDGLVTIEDNVSSETVSEKSEGLKLRGGLISQYFITNPTLQQAIYDDTMIFVTDQSLTLGEEMLRIMQAANQKGHKKCVIIANDITGSALSVAVLNRNQQVFNVMPVKVVGFGEHAEGFLRDVCAVAGATFITPKDGRKVMDFTETEFGHVDKVVATLSDVLIIGGDGDKEARVQELQGQLSNAKDFSAEALKERIAKMHSAVCVVKVGSVVDAEREEIRLRAEDAINATRAALANGVVAGGGAALYRAASAAKHYILQKACEVPLRLIASNSGVELDRGDLNKLITDSNLTINFNSGEVINAYTGGVIDPLNVVINAIQNAAKTAASFLTSEGCVIETTDTSEKL
ncbi:MAG TPA: chaperonin GroEL [Patescibacteria group bacterium]|jgi:chaperonin GroEL|nr:chaperonin GroEL [Patescibacteria group bacterium]